MSIPPILRTALIRWEDARAQVLSCAKPLPGEPLPLGLGRIGQVLSADATAQLDLPAADVSVMDGYAARADDLANTSAQAQGPTLVVRGESAAGAPWPNALGRGEAVQISTGAVLPLGATIVLPRETVHRDGASLVVDLEAVGEVRAGRWIRARGGDIGRGARVLTCGLQLAPADLAAAAAAGIESVGVHRRPHVAIVSTGTELIPRGQMPTPTRGEVISTNDLLLEARVGILGGISHNLGLVPDDPGALRRALTRALEHDIVVTSGGMSVGEHDLVRSTLEALGVKFAFHGVAMRPGKPVAFGTRGDTLVFGLPGNPASTWVGFELFAAPAVAAALGAPQPADPFVGRAALAAPARGAGNRAHFVRARRDQEGMLTPLSTQASGDLRSMTAVDALVLVPPHQDFATGDAVVYMPTKPFDQWPNG